MTVVILLRPHVLALMLALAAVLGHLLGDRVAGWVRSRAQQLMGAQ